MSTTTKELPSPALSNAAADAAARQTGAVGAEIPVIVHASRYSATKGIGKQLPPVHEETRTVIVFPQGAVVRLTASMNVAELVVLTNRQTGADALCRVVNVKTQPGIQNYVNLEFTQRAPGFWAECIQSEHAEGGASSSPSSSAPATVIAMPAAEAMPSAKTGTPGPLLVSSPAFAQRGEKPQSSPFNSLESAAPASLSQPATRNWPRQIAAPAQDEAPSKTKNVALIAVAAVVLLAIGAGGGALLLRHGRAAASAQQAENNATAAAQPALPAQPEPSTPAPAIAAPAAAPVNSSAASETPSPALVETRPASEPSKAPTQESSSQAARRSSAPNAVNVAKISAPVAKAPARTVTNDAPPVLSAQAGMPGAGLTPGLLGAASTSSPVAPPPPVSGGKLQEPKLISSSSAVYPDTARAARIQGDVVVDAVVDATGKITAVQVVSGPLALRQAALDAVRTWKYEPARLNGKPIEIHTQVSLSFHMN